MASQAPERAQTQPGHATQHKITEKIQFFYNIEKMLLGNSYTAPWLQDVMLLGWGGCACQPFGYDKLKLAVAVELGTNLTPSQGGRAVI